MKQFRTYQLAITFYRESQTLKLDYHLKDQLLRAASSVVLNLAEGSGKRTFKDKRRFYDIAFGSLRECQAIIELSDKPNCKGRVIADVLGAHLYKLIQATGEN